jgi:tetratricopeptide (TPR) repeat protein
MSQNSLAVLAAAAVISAAAGAGAALFVGRKAEPQAAPASSANVVERAAFEALVARNAALEKDLAALRTRVEMAPSETRTSVSDDAVAAAVERWMRANAEQLASAAPAAVTEDAGAAARERERSIADALAKLEDPALSDAARQRLWKELFQAGLGDQVLAELEARAERDPNDPNARCDLAQAYLQKLFNVPMGPEQGLWGTKADKAFDAALALDENHWEARFGKAVALSNWPAFLGKQPEAIKHFEVLIQQQSRQAFQLHFVNTHLILGNMYMQAGQKDKALATWQTGAAQFPSNESLRKQIELAGG